MIRPEMKTHHLFYILTLFLCLICFFSANSVAQVDDTAVELELTASSEFNYTFESIEVPGVDFLAEYIDTWQGDTDGNTCCQAKDLLNAFSGHTKRIDQIFVCNSESDVTVLMTQTVGDTPSDRLASGLWPSDHAGVVAELLF